jgi:hypothetical protein
MKCAICHDRLDPESPFNVYGINPLTLRLAWMHGWCAQAADEQAREISATDDRFENRAEQAIGYEIGY